MRFSVKGMDTHVSGTMDVFTCFFHQLLMGVFTLFPVSLCRTSTTFKPVTDRFSYATVIIRSHLLKTAFQVIW